MSQMNNISTAAMSVSTLARHTDGRITLSTLAADQSLVFLWTDTSTQSCTQKLVYLLTSL